VPIDIALLAGTVVTQFLIPYLKSGAEKITEEITGAASKTAAEHVDGVMDKVWARVTSLFGGTDDETLLTQLEKRPEAAGPLVSSALQERLAQDSRLAEELNALVNGPGPEGQSAAALIKNAGIAGIADARNANFQGAQNVRIAGVHIGGGAPIPTPPPIPPEPHSSGSA